MLVGDCVRSSPDFVFTDSRAACAPQIVEFSPSDIIRRRSANWSAIQADTIELTRREPFQYGFQTWSHLLVVYWRAGGGDRARSSCRSCRNRPYASSVAS